MERAHQNFLNWQTFLRQFFGCTCRSLNINNHLPENKKRKKKISFRTCNSKKVYGFSDWLIKLEPVDSKWTNSVASWFNFLPSSKKF